jgi:LacI family transcriptional regulator
MNLEEVAKRAKVSTATVSRVLNNVQVVKPTTRARVMKAIADLNYHPNLHARSLAGGKSRTIGMIVSNLENPFFLDIFQTVEALALSRDYDVVVANTGYKTQQLVHSVRLMIGRRVAGLAVMVSEMDPALMQELTLSRIPTVFYDVGSARQNITNIRVNYRKGIESLVGYLHNLGHRRIGFVGHHDALDPISERAQTLMELAAKYSPHLEVKRAGDADSLEGGRLGVREILRSGFDPTAIMCVNDLMAIGVLRELRDWGLRVPEDISVTGFDNIRWSEFCFPRLTTIHIPREQIGKMSVEALLNNSAMARAGRDIVIDPEFLVRESTGPARK